MGSYWKMIAGIAWRDSIADFRRAGIATITSAITLVVFIATGFSMGAPSLGFVGAGLFAVVRFGWAMLKVPPTLHKTQKATEDFKAMARALEGKLKEGMALLNDSACGSEPWAARMVQWHEGVLELLSTYDESERVMFETIGDPLPQPGTVAYSNQVIDHFEAKMAKLRLIVGRAYDHAPKAKS